MNLVRDLQALGSKGASVGGWFRSAALAAGLAALAACAAKTPAARFYLLQAQPLASAGALAAVVGVGPVELPAYLDRPQIVTGGAGPEMRLDEFQRWAEPLRDNFAQALADDLARQLPASHILPYPWNRAIAPDYQIGVRVARFHVNEAGQCELEANWSVLRRNQLVFLKSFRVKVPASDAGYDAKVTAQSRALASFSQEIAGALLETQAP
jgi:uncharacterized lipoprotein YmbA